MIHVLFDLTIFLIIIRAWWRTPHAQGISFVFFFFFFNKKGIRLLLNEAWMLFLLLLLLYALNGMEAHMSRFVVQLCIIVRLPKVGI